MSEDSPLITKEIFSDIDAMNNWILKQPWFRSAVLNDTLKLGDAIFPFNLLIQHYGGFLGIFKKANYRTDYVCIDQKMIDLCRVAHNERSSRAA